MDRTRRVASDERILWGHKFTWTPEHSSMAELRPLLYSYDKLATDALDVLDEISPPPTTPATGCPMSQRDLYALVEEHAEVDETLGKLWREVTTVPDWVDWEQLARGQAIVHQYSGQILLGLMFRSLVGGMAAWRVVETLSKTGGFGVQVTRRRLLETLQHFLEVNEDIEAVKPGGRGFASSVRVRLLHAMVRRRIMRLAAETPSYFDTEALGAPINDLHQMGTISVYSTAVLFVALPAQGVRLSERQTADYLALWRWVGHVMGTPVDYMASPQTAKAMLESIMCSEFDPSINSQIIANNILSAEADMPPYRLPRGFLCAQAHRLIGSTQAIALGIEMPSLRNRLFVELQSVFLWLYALPYPILPAAGKEARRQRFLKLGWDVINNRKTGGRGEASKFDMQFIPELGKTTELVPIKVAARLKPTTGATLAIALAFIVVSFMAVVGLVQTSPAWLDMVPRPSVSPFLMQA